ncbi:MAG: biotin transporter BioY [Bacillota bacterium]|nr:biotin transporter BioY [Bacillota bacterium]
MKITTKEMILVSFFAALSVVAAMVSKYGGEAVVPFSLMPLITMLAGVLLGGRLGALSILVYILLGIVGLPVFAKPPYGGLGYFLQPTAGFIFGFMAGAWAIGVCMERLNRKKISSYLLASLVGLVVIYLIGLPYLYFVLNYYVGANFSITGVLQIALLPYIGFDLAKVVIASVLGLKIYERLSSSNLIGHSN